MGLPKETLPFPGYSDQLCDLPSVFSSVKRGYGSCQSGVRTVNIQPAFFPKVLTTVAGTQEAKRVLTMFNTMKLFMVPQMAF